VKAVMPKSMVFNVPDRALSKRRLDFQQHLIKEYVRKDPKQTKTLLSNPQKGYMIDTSAF
jgi:hypothetical protein